MGKKAAKMSSRQNEKNRNFAKAYGTKKVRKPLTMKSAGVVVGGKRKTTKPRKINTKAVTGTVIPTTNKVETFNVQDTIIAALKLPETTDIKIEIGPTTVTLYVGPRDWQWNRDSKIMIGSGTLANAPLHENYIQTTNETEDTEADEMVATEVERDNAAGEDANDHATSLDDGDDEEIETGTDLNDPYDGDDEL